LLKISFRALISVIAIIDSTIPATVVVVVPPALANVVVVPPPVLVAVVVVGFPPPLGMGSVVVVVYP